MNQKIYKAIVLLLSFLTTLFLFLTIAGWISWKNSLALLEKERKEFVNKNSELRNLLDRKQSEITTAQEKILVLDIETKKVLNQYRDAMRNIEDLENTIYCENKETFSYKDNTTMMDELVNFVNEHYYGKVVSKEIYPLYYEGSDAATYTIKKDEYFYQYIVYYNKPDWNHKNSVYDVYGNCFVDIDR